MNVLGVPETEDEWSEVLSELASHADRVMPRETMEATYMRESQLASATRRWTFAPFAVHPSHRVPGDVLGLRARASHTDVDSTYRPIAYSGVRARITFGATPYWIPTRYPATMAERVTTSNGPAVAEVRLGNPEVSAWWPSPIEIDLGPIDHLPHEWASDTPIEVPVTTPWPMVDTTRAWHSASKSRAELDGVILLAGPDGIMRDLCLWVVTTYEKSDIRTAPVGHLLPGRPSRSAWPLLCSGLAALIAWGDWLTPAGPIRLPVRLRRPDLRSLTNPDIRRRERDGALGYVRVLAAPKAKPPLDSPTKPKGNPDTASTHASPVGHPRIGHWRRSWVGSGEDRHAEWRWIEFTLVNGGWVDDERLTVWRLPTPKRQGLA